MRHYISFDVGKQWLVMYDGEEERKIRNVKGLDELDLFISTKYRNRVKDIVFMFEPTGTYSNNLKDFAVKRNIKVLIINPLRVHNFSKALGNRSKTDSIDARTIYRMRKIMDEDDISPPLNDERVDKLTKTLSTYRIIKRMRHSLMNHNSETHSDIKLLKDKITEEIERLKLLEDEIVRTIIDEIIERDEELSRSFHLILTIPGIGVISGVSLLLLFIKYKNTNRNEITSLLGLDPVLKESGISVKGKSRISKRGNGMIRSILYFPTMSAIRHNNRIREFYKRLLDRGKPKKVALIASMKKLLLIAHAVYKSGIPYREKLTF